MPLFPLKATTFFQTALVFTTGFCFQHHVGCDSCFLSSISKCWANHQISLSIMILANYDSGDKTINGPYSVSQWCSCFVLCYKTLSFTVVHFSPLLGAQTHSQPGCRRFSSGQAKMTEREFLVNKKRQKQFRCQEGITWHMDVHRKSTHTQVQAGTVVTHCGSPKTLYK